MPRSNFQDCDVLIVGGGPAGSSCARRLVHAGLDVLIMDRATFPRDKVCAGWITPPIIEELALNLEEYRRHHVLQPIRGFRTGVLGVSLLETDYGRPVSYAIRRCEFDAYLLQHSGARTLEGVPFQSAERTHDGWLINNSIRAKLLIGAGGHFCPVARLLNPQPESPRDVVLAQEVEFALTEAEARSCAVSPEIPELYFFEDLKGYAWCVRKGDFINIGLGRIGSPKDQADNLAVYRVRFLETLMKMGRISCPPRPPFRGHAYRIYLARQRRLFDDRVLLIGDAAGLASAQSGEGIRPAIESGLFAADVVAQTAPLFRSGDLKEYEHRLRNRFGRPKTVDSAPSAPWDRLRTAIARRLLRNRWFTRHVLLDRWFLQRHLKAIQ